MTNIYKYRLPRMTIPGRIEIIQMAKDAQILSCQAKEDEEIYIWALEKEGSVKVAHRFAYFFTGNDWDIPENAKFLATLEPIKGYILHIFDLGEKSNE